MQVRAHLHALSLAVEHSVDLLEKDLLIVIKFVTAVVAMAFYIWVGDFFLLVMHTESVVEATNANKGPNTYQDKAHRGIVFELTKDDATCDNAADNQGALIWWDGLHGSEQCKKHVQEIQIAAGTCKYQEDVCNHT